MERWVAKLLAAIIIFVSNVLAGILPVKVADWFESKGEKGKLYLSLANCFGGGVFFGAYLMHMSPEVREMMTEVYLVPNNISYPLPELMAAIGFFLVLFLDTFINIMVTKKARVNSIEMTGCSDVHQNEKGQSPLPVGHTNRAMAEENGTVHSEKAPADFGMTEMNTDSDEDELLTRPFIVLAGLSFHFLFEGMSLGLQDTTRDVWTLVIAIVSHELVISFSFGLRIVKLFSLKKVIGIMVAYSSAIPIGIAIGAIIYETAGGSEEVDIMSAFILALSAGIFIYVAFLEILAGELTQDVYMSKIVAIALGFIFMACMVLVEEIGGDENGDVTTQAPPITVP